MTNWKSFRTFLFPFVKEDGPEFGRLLASFEAVLPLREPSGLGLLAMRDDIAAIGRDDWRSRGVARREVTETVPASGQEQIDAASVEAAEYQPPTLRRRMFERELR